MNIKKKVIFLLNLKARCSYRIHSKLTHWSQFVLFAAILSQALLADLQQRLCDLTTTRY